MVERQVVGDEIQDKPDPFPVQPVLEFLEVILCSEARVKAIGVHCIRGADHVFFAPIGQGCFIVFDQPILEERTCLRAR